MAFQMSIIAIGAVVLQFALNGLGAVAVAAFTAAQKIDQIATQPMNSFGTTMATYAAQNYGAGKTERIRRGVLQCSLISVGVCRCDGTGEYFCRISAGRNLCGTGEPEVASLAQTYLIINGSMYFLLAMLFIFRFTLQGLGKGVMPTVAGGDGIGHEDIFRCVFSAIFRICGGMLVQSPGLAGSLYPTDHRVLCHCEKDGSKNESKTPGAVNLELGFCANLCYNSSDFSEG